MIPMARMYPYSTQNVSRKQGQAATHAPSAADARTHDRLLVEVVQIGSFAHCSIFVAG